MTKTTARKTRNPQRGFTLLEIAASLLILSLVIGVVAQGITTTEARNRVETSKLDLTQESREFMNQIVSDLHQSGFPTIGMFDPSSLTSPTDCTLDANVACGLISISPTAIQFEGDVDGTGVSEGFIQLVQSNGPNAAACTTPPCVIQRGTISKADWMQGQAPAYYTEVNGVMNTNVFTAFDHDGNPIVINPAITSQAWTYNISAIGITLYVKSSHPDPKTGTYPMVTLVSTAKIND